MPMVLILLQQVEDILAEDNYINRLQVIRQMPAFQVVMERPQVCAVPGYCLGALIFCPIADLVVVDEL